MRASHAPCGRVYQNPKFFLTIPFSAGGVGGAGKKWKGKFLVLVPLLHSSRKDLLIYFSIVAILRPSFPPSFAAARHAPVTAFSGSSNVRSHFASTSHWPLAFARDACSVLASCSLRGFGRVCGNSIKRIALGANKSVCACPTHPVRTQNPSATRTAP